MKAILADTHVHVYPCHRVEDVFRSAWANLAGLADSPGDLTFLLFLTERSDCRFFHDLAEGKAPMADGWETTSACDENACCVRRAADHATLCILRGRQIATKERLEVLSLAGDPELTDGCTARQAIEETLSAGAVPVLPWAPGKWLFERGRQVEELLRVYHPGQLLIGDTTLRPAALGEPRLMRKARTRGFKVVAGTDPLPFAGEECGVGRYGVAWEGDLGEYSLVRDIRRMLLDPLCAMRTVGRRDSVLSVARRLIRNYQAKAPAGRGEGDCK